MHMTDVLLVAGLSVLAGAITTVAGMGGGMLLLLALAAWWDPAMALAVTAPALLLGNAHRAFLFRREVQWPTALRFAGAAVPGAIIGGALAVSFPGWLIQGLMVVMTLLALAKGVGWIKVKPPQAALVPTGGVVGVLTGASGGAGILMAPVLLATGLVRDAYVGTVAVCAAMMHAGRIISYGAGGLITADTLLYAGLAAAGILGGNFVGRYLRRFTLSWPAGLIEHVTLASCVVVALLGIKP